ncbi:hypothetical protein BCV71DRAFT_271338 [Rhizopus microsporus]|uniref:Uncharacterized protein n=1 Tax=Rhizopus microsporus TaxID=58291 RepID=A0A1X0RXH9_RHIZD|nr:hypothetical protein BCV71DRAFT_271338 [Rhizopus microsporus]
MVSNNNKKILLVVLLLLLLPLVLIFLFLLTRLNPKVPAVSRKLVLMIMTLTWKLFDEDVSVADSNSDIKKNFQTNINKFHNEIYKSTQAVILAKNPNDADKHSIHFSFLKKLKQVQETYEMLFKD